MTITLDSQYFAAADDKLLGYCGENNARTVSFVGLGNVTADVYSLVLSYSDGVTYETRILENSVTLTSSMMRIAGNVDAQVLACCITDGEYTVVKKSNIIGLVIKPSIDESAKPVPALTDTLRMLDGLEQLSSSLADITESLVTEQEDIDSDITSLSQMQTTINERFTTCLNSITAAAQNVNALVSSIQDSADRIYINSTSIGMHKKNILKTDASTKQLYGVTMTVNSDGSVTLNGTNSDRYTSLVLSSDDAYDNVKHIPNGSYILCSNSIPGAAVVVMGYKYVNDARVERSLAFCNSTAPVSFTVDDSYDYNYVEIYIDPEQTYTNKLVKPMIRLAGIANDDWEAYTPSLQEQIDELRTMIQSISPYSESLSEHFEENVQEVTA